MRNTEKQKVSSSVFLTRYKTNIAFRQGYNDYVNNLGYNVDDFSETVNQIKYERGRAFAAYSAIKKTPKAIWRKDVLAKTTQNRLLDAMRTSYVL